MSLLERLREAGTLDSEGQFTIDVARARDKMARFQLTDPSRYILELVAAAVANGAGRIDLRTRPFEVRFDGEPLAALDHLDDFLFGSETEHLALRHLAVGLNALRQLNFSEIRLESRSGAALVRTAKGDRLEHDRFEHNAVRVKTGLLGLGPSPWSQSTQDIVTSRCRHLNIPLTIDGEELTRTPGTGLALALGQTADAPSALTLVRLGVVVSERELGALVPFTAVVWEDGLRLNASHSDVVEDEVYQAVLRACREEAERQLLERARDFRGEPSARTFLLALAPAFASRDEFLSCELFPLVGGGFAGGRALEEQSRSLGGSVPVAHKAFDFQPEGLKVVQLGDDDVGEALKAMFGAKRLKNVEDRLLREFQAGANRARWETSPRPATLPPGSWLVRRPIDFPECRGEIGLDLVQGQKATVHVLYRGKLLATRALSGQPSFTAVLDFPELEVDDTWSGPADPRFDRAVSRLGQELPSLYQALAERGWESPVQGVREHLLECLMRLGNDAPESIRSAGLFFTASGERLSLTTLRQAGQVHTLPAGCELPELPPETLGPQPLLIVDASERKALEKLLGRRRVKDFSSQLPRLEKLAERLKDRREPILTGNSVWMVRFNRDGVKGELGLIPSGKSKVTLLRRGVALGARELSPLGPAFEAIAECPALTPDKEWRHAQDDQAWSTVKQVVREAEAQACRELVEAAEGEGVATPQRRKALLEVAASCPDLAPRLAKLPLFPLVHGRTVVSAERLAEEQSQHGQLLHDQTTHLPGRLVLKTPSSLRQRALTALLPDHILEPARPLIARENARQAFLRRRTVDRLKLPALCLRSLELTPPSRGLVGVLPPGQSGWVQVYHEDRLLVEKKDQLPEGFCAVLSHPELTPSEGWDDVLNLDQVLPAVQEGCLQLALEHAELEPVLRLCGWKSVSRAQRRLLEEAPLVPVLGGGRVSLEALRKAYGSRKFLRVIAPTDGPPQEPPVVMAPPELWEPLGRHLTRKTRDFSSRLRQQQQVQAEVARLPDTLPSCLVQVEVETTAWRGCVGVPVDPREAAFVFLAGNEPVAQADSPGLLACGVLEGVVRRDPNSARAELDKTQREELNALTLQAYAALEPAYPRLKGKSQKQARNRLLECLLEVRRRMGGTGPEAELAARLLQLRLIRIPMRQRVSLAQLVEEAEERGRLVYLESDRWPPAGEDGLLPILPEGSLERQVCLELLGKQVLVAWEPAPRSPLVDVTAVRQRLTDAYRWGISAVAPATDLFRTAGAHLKVGLAQALAAQASAPRPAEKPPAQDQDKAFLSAIRREFAALVPRKPRAAGRKLVERLDYSMWPLGPAVHWDNRGLLRLNRANGLIRWIREHHEEDPAALVTLVVHLFCHINHRQDNISPEQEKEFLYALARSLRGAFEDGKP